MTQDKTQEALKDFNHNLQLKKGHPYDFCIVRLLPSSVEIIRQALQSQPTNEMIYIPVDLFRLLIQYWNNEEVSKDDGYYIRTMIATYENHIPEVRKMVEPHTCTASGFECLPPVNEATGHDTE